MQRQHSLVCWWIPFIVLCVCSYLIQINLYLHKDVSILAHTAAQLLQGQTYAHRIFDPNLPLVFYLHTIPVLITQFTGIKIIYVLRAVVIVLIAWTVWCSHTLLKKLIFSKPAASVADYRLLYGMSYAIAVVLLLLPADEFGQREHIFLILTLPYMLLAVCRLQHRSVPYTMAIMIGIMAGIGFSIKPFFLSTWLLLEGYFVYKEKKFLGWFRIEAGIAFCIMVVYAMGVLIFYPDYLSIILPLWMPYYHGIIGSWTNLVTAPLFLWCCASIALYCYDKKETTNAQLKQILALSILGTLVSYLIPQVSWYYHIYPAVSLAFLYFTLLLSDLFTSKTSKALQVAELRTIGLLSLVVFFIPITHSTLRLVHAITYFHSPNPERKIISLLDTYPGHNQYMFLSMTHNLYNLEFYSTAYNVGSFSSCTWEYSRLGPYSKMYKKQLFTYALRTMAQNINEQKPQFIIVDRPSAKIYLNQWIDYPANYAKNPHFRAAWSHYTYLTSIKPYDIYQRM